MARSDGFNCSDAVLLYLKRYPGKNTDEFNGHYGYASDAVRAKAKLLLHEAMQIEPEQFLRTQMENHVPRIEYVLPDGFDSVDQVALQRRETYSAMEINFLNQHAAEFGYRRVGNEWVYGTG